jgi:dephospho-CoA kinase
MLIGLTGGIACGKSTVSAMLARKGAIIVDADLIARLVVAPGSDGLKQLVQAFGKQILDENGALQRATLAQIVFADPRQREVLERITHPLIAQESNRQILEALAQKPPLVVYDAALLFESGRAEAFRPVVVVALEREEQIRRVMLRDGGGRLEAERRIEAQMGLEKKVAMADLVIDNSGGMEDLERQVEGVFERFGGR